jgi:hypothetical protein
MVRSIPVKGFQRAYTCWYFLQARREKVQGRSVVALRELFLQHRSQWDVQGSLSGQDQIVLTTSGKSYGYYKYEEIAVC